MFIEETQQEMHSAFLGGFVGQLIAGIIWAGQYPSYTIHACLLSHVGRGLYIALLLP